MQNLWTFFPPITTFIKIKTATAIVPHFFKGY